MTYKFAVCLFLSTLMVQAQPSGPELPAPVPVHQVLFHHWPEQFVQWIGPELPYSMIELYADPADKAGPLYDVVLTERASEKRIHYSDRQTMVDLNKKTGAEAYLTRVQLDRPPSPGPNAAYVLRFVDHSGAPVIWQFVQASPIGERGGGLSPAGDQPPVLMYRERSAIAAQESALKIGNVTSPIEVWKEISQPPFFVAYHGALTEDLDTATFVESGEQWTTVRAPASLQVGAEWKLKAGDGRESTLRVASLVGDIAVVSEDLGSKGTLTIEARFAEGAWSTRKIHFLPAGPSSAKGISVAFTPGVTTATEQARFEVFSGKTRIATGNVSLDAKQKTTGWQFKEPDWLKSRPNKVQSAQNPVADNNR